MSDKKRGNLDREGIGRKRAVQRGRAGKSQRQRKGIKYPHGIDSNRM